jgi:hypothetical protein
LCSNSILQKNKLSVLSTKGTEIMSNFDDFLSCEDNAVLFSSSCIEELGEILRVAKYCREKYIALVSSIDQYLLSVRVTISKKLDETRLIQEKLDRRFCRWGTTGCQNLMSQADTWPDKM